MVSRNQPGEEKGEDWEGVGGGEESRCRGASMAALETHVKEVAVEWERKE